MHSADPLDELEIGAIPIIRQRQMLLVPVQTPPTDSQARSLLDRVLAVLSTGPFTAVVIEVSSLEVIDSYLTRIFYDIAHAARSLGVRAALVGIQPAVAITLVQMGIETLDIPTFLNLDDAMTALEGSP